MTIELDEKDTNLLLRALGELPAKDSIAMILRIQAEWAKSQEPAASEKE